jgi:hypothetical protein
MYHNSYHGSNRLKINLDGTGITRTFSSKLPTFLMSVPFYYIYLPNHNCEYRLCVLIWTKSIPVVFFILSNALASAKKSFVFNMRNSLFPSFIYSKPQSPVHSRVSQIHSSHSSIDSCVGCFTVHYMRVLAI